MLLPFPFMFRNVFANSSLIYFFFLLRIIHFVVPGGYLWHTIYSYTIHIHELYFGLQLYIYHEFIQKLGKEM